MKLETARQIVTEVADMLRPNCERLEIGGSIRRSTKADVKDGEIVAIPKPDLLDTLDALVEQGIIAKALYGDSKTTRWGPKYRGIQYKGMKVELFLADEQNWGFQFALRSGPGDANEYIMSFLSWKRVPIRFQEGYCWHSPSNGWQQVEKSGKKTWTAKDRRQLSIATEHDFFAVLGMPFIPPERRSVDNYIRLLEDNSEHEWPDFTKYYAVSKKPTTAELMPLAPYFSREEGAFPLSANDERLAAEREYNAGVMARHEDLIERAARGEPLERHEQRILNNRREIEMANLYGMQVAEGLPILVTDFVGNHVGILGMTGLGKSNSVAVLCEELAGRLPLTIIDLESEYHSLREVYPFIVAGRGEHVDQVVSVSDAEALAEEILRGGLSVILDLYDYEKDERNEFVRRYLDRLFDVAGELRTPHTVVIEEASEYFHQRRKSPVSEAAERLASRGRKRGLGLILASQRPASVDKNVLNMCKILFLHGVQFAQDISAYCGMLPRAFNTAEVAQSLPIGQAIVRYKGVNGKYLVQVSAIRKRLTEDLGATPMLGVVEVNEPDISDRIRRLQKA